MLHLFALHTASYAVRRAEELPQAESVPRCLPHCVVRFHAYAAVLLLFRGQAVRVLHRDRKWE